MNLGNMFQAEKTADERSYRGPQTSVLQKQNRGQQSRTKERKVVKKVLSRGRTTEALLPFSQEVVLLDFSQLLAA